VGWVERGLVKWGWLNGAEGFKGVVMGEFEKQKVYKVKIIKLTKW